MRRAPVPASQFLLFVLPWAFLSTAAGLLHSGVAVLVTVAGILIYERLAAKAWNKRPASLAERESRGYPGWLAFPLALLLLVAFGLAVAAGSLERWLGVPVFFIGLACWFQIALWARDWTLRPDM